MVVHWYAVVARERGPFSAAVREFVTMRAGHMLVANVAMLTVKPNTLTQANQLIALLDQWYPASPDFRQSACWADDLKSEVLRCAVAPPLGCCPLRCRSVLYLWDAPQDCRGGWERRCHDHVPTANLEVGDVPCSRAAGVCPRPPLPSFCTLACCLCMCYGRGERPRRPPRRPPLTPLEVRFVTLSPPQDVSSYDDWHFLNIPHVR